MNAQRPEPRLRPATLIDKRPAAGEAQTRAQHEAGYHGHNVTITALALALAREFVAAHDKRQVEAFLSYFAQQSQRLAAQTGVAAIEAAAEQKTSQLAAMLLAKHIEVYSG